jgi:Zn-dependent protease with chaperone function
MKKEPDLIRTLHGIPSNAASAWAENLKREGFEVLTHRSGEGIELEAQIRNQPWWRLLWRRIPMLVTARFTPVGPSRVRIAATCSSSVRFKLWLLGTIFCSILGSIFVIWFGMIGEILRIFSTTTTSYVIGLGFVAMGLNGFALSWVVTKGTQTGPFLESIVDSVQDELGGSAELDQSSYFSREGFYAFVVGLLTFNVFTVPAGFSLFGVLLLVLVSIFAWSYFFLIRRRGRGVQSRWAEDVIAFRLGFFLTVLATIPVWGLSLYRSVQRTIDLHDINAEYLSGQFTVSVSVLIVFGFILVSLVQDTKFFERIIAIVDLAHMHPRAIDRTWCVDIAFLGIWFVMALAQWFGILEALILFKMVTMNRRQPFDTASGSLLHELDFFALGEDETPWVPVLFITVYGGMFAVLFMLVLYRNLRLILDSWKIRLKAKQPPFDVESAVYEMCAFANVRVPRMLVLPWMTINAYVLLPLFPGCQNTLVISDGTLNRIAPRQRDALLAHEIGHIKQHHNVTLGILSFLSRWTFVGNTFLSRLARGSIRMEQDADRFAITWLEHKGESREQLIEVLRAIESDKLKAHFSDDCSPRLAVSGGDWLPQAIREGFQKRKQLSFVERVALQLRATYFFYFENWIGSYTYLPFHQRIEAIRAM